VVHDTRPRKRVYHVMPQELIPKVELWQLSEHVTQALKEIVRDALVEHCTVERSPVGGMRAAEAAAYVGIGRSTFYKLIKTEAHLQHSYVVGTARMWRKEDLDAWMQAQVESNQIHPENQAGHFVKESKR
jgi:excisionase family DNA binding protein